MANDGDTLSEYNDRVWLTGIRMDKLDKMVDRVGRDIWLPDSAKELLKEVESRRRLEDFKKR